MKQILIFAALLLTTGLSVKGINDNPPLVKPEADQIVLVPQDMHDIDRSIVYCCYTYHRDERMISITCIGTGNDTELMLTDSKGNIVAYAAVMPEINPCTSLDVPDTDGTYILILESDTYYGEGIIIAD